MGVGFGDKRVCHLCGLKVSRRGFEKHYGAGLCTRISRQHSIMKANEGAAPSRTKSALDAVGLKYTVVRGILPGRERGQYVAITEEWAAFICRHFKGREMRWALAQYTADKPGWIAMLESVKALAQPGEETKTVADHIHALFEQRPFQRKRRKKEEVKNG